MLIAVLACSWSMRGSIPVLASFTNDIRTRLGTKVSTHLQAFSGKPLSYPARVSCKTTCHVLCHAPPIAWQACIQDRTLLAPNLMLHRCVSAVHMRFAPSQ
jgi:hypothetical protein